MRFSSFFVACSGALTALVPALPTLADTAVPQETVAQEEVVVVRRQVVVRRRRDAEAVAVRYVDRPLTLPKRTLSLELEGSYMHEAHRFGDDPAGELSLSGEYGITDDLEIDATPLAIQSRPTIDR